MKKPKIFIACDTTNLAKVKKIIKHSKTNRIIIGYKFGLEFLNSKNGRKFISNLKNQITFGDYKISDIPNTCVATIKAIKENKFTAKDKNNHTPNGFKEPLFWFKGNSVAPSAIVNVDDFKEGFENDFFMLQDKNHLSIEANKFISKDLSIFLKNTLY